MAMKRTFKPLASEITFYNRGRGISAPDVQSAIEFLGGEYNKVNVKAFGAVGDGVTDDTEAILKARDHVLAQGRAALYFPAGVYIMNQPLSFSQPIRIEGEHKSKSVIHFNECNGIETEGRVDGFVIENIAIRGTETQDTIGIHLQSYSSSFRISDFNIEGFGGYGIAQYGGLHFAIERGRIIRCGRQHSESLGASILLSQTASGSPPTTGTLKGIYLTTGGRYGYRQVRGSAITLENITVEYHDQPASWQQGSATCINLYCEANRGYDGDYVTCDDARVTFIRPRLDSGTEIKLRWSGTDFSSRSNVHIGSTDISARHLEGNLVKLRWSSRMSNLEEEGNLRWNAPSKTLEVFDGTEWRQVNLSPPTT